MFELLAIIVGLMVLAGAAVFLSIVFGVLHIVLKVALLPIALVGKIVGAILIPVVAIVGVVLLICFLPALLALAEAACVLVVGALLFAAIF